MFQNNGTAAMLVYLDNPVGIEFFSYVKTSIDAGHVSENALLFSGYYTHPKRNRRQWLCKILGIKEDALWMRKS